jgi:hypothetical protein
MAAHTSIRPIDTEPTVASAPTDIEGNACLKASSVLAKENWSPTVTTIMAHTARTRCHLESSHSLGADADPSS